MPEDEEVVTTTEDEAIETDTEVVEDTSSDTETTTTAAAETTETTVDYKAKWENQRQVNRDLERKLREANQKIADADKTADEIEQERAQREVEQAALAKANDRIVRQEIRLAAKGRLNDPADALDFLKVADFEVGDDGEVDADAIEDALTELLRRKPYLAVAAEETKRFQSGVDQGAKGKDTKPSQLSRDDLKSMSPAQILAAHKEGRLSKISGR